MSGFRPDYEWFSGQIMRGFRSGQIMSGFRPDYDVCLRKILLRYILSEILRTARPPNFFKQLETPRTENGYKITKR